MRHVFAMSFSMRTRGARDWPRKVYVLSFSKIRWEANMKTLPQEESIAFVAVVVTLGVQWVHLVFVRVTLNKRSNSRSPLPLNTNVKLKTTASEVSCNW